MAKDTSLSLRNKIIYQVFVRNYSKEGTFKALELDLDRIKDLGVDYIYLLPIHEIGQKERKGSMGSPYSIKDYYSITSDYGTEEDLKSLINSAHNKDMKIILDIVFHHTSKDSILLNEHPEWFYSKNGKICNRIEDWSDVSDLDFEKDKSLWEYLIDVLKYWAKIGVDGFRCDVSSLVPIEFWIYAREEISKIKEDFLWISESTHYGFIKYNRDRGYYACEEPKMYDAFDMSYDYDVEPLMARYLRNEDTLKPYIDGLINQEGNFPTNYIKMHNLENHDFDRIALYLANDHLRILNWHTFLYMLKGSVMIYAGEEFEDSNKPNLFEKDIVNYNGTNISKFLYRLSLIKHKDIFTNGIYNISITKVKDVVEITWENEKEKIISIVDLGIQNSGKVDVELSDGNYINYINEELIKIKNHQIYFDGYPVIIHYYKTKQNQKYIESK